MGTLRNGFKAARKRAGYSQQDVADKLHNNIKTVRNWEQGISVPEYSTMLELCDLFNCDLDFLAGRIEEPTHDIKFIHEKTGLSVDAIKKLMDNKEAIEDSPLSKIIEHDNSDRLLRVLSLAADEDEITWMDLGNIPRELLSSQVEKPIDFSPGIGSDVADYLASRELSDIIKRIRSDREEEREREKATQKWHNIGRKFNLFREQESRKDLLEYLEETIRDYESISEDPEIIETEEQWKKIRSQIDALNALYKKVELASFAEWKRGELRKEVNKIIEED